MEPPQPILIACMTREDCSKWGSKWVVVLAPSSEMCLACPALWISLRQQSFSSPRPPYPSSYLGAGERSGRRRRRREIEKRGGIPCCVLISKINVLTPPSAGRTMLRLNTSPMIPSLSLSFFLLAISGHMMTWKSTLLNIKQVLMHHPWNEIHVLL